MRLSNNGVDDIAFIIGNLNKEHGGAQQLLFNICRHLPGSEFNTTVYYMFGEGTYKDEFEEFGTTVIDLGATSNYDLITFYEFIQKLRSADHDILHTNSPISGSWGRPAAKLGGVSNIVSVEHNVHTAYDWFTQSINGLTLPLADAVVGVSESVSESYLDWEKRLLSGSTQCMTIRNGVDIEAIRQTFGQSEEVLKKYTPYSPSDFIIGTMGRLHKQKGYKYLLRAFAKIKRHSEDVRLLVIGDGPERGRLQTIVDKSGYSEDVHFTGYVPNVYPFLPNFDIAVFPSLWEGFGLTPVESMVAQCPVIGTDIPVFREVIGDAGILVEPESASKLATAIVSLIESPSHRQELGQAGYGRAVKNFSIERTVKEYVNLYQNLTNK
jgi:glycosyltransferase involved in cell wall biosynthesis